MKIKTSLLFTLLMICSYAGPSKLVTNDPIIANTPSIVVADEAPGIYVSALGSDGNNGFTLASPVKTITRGIQLAQASGRNFVRILAGTYNESINLVNGIHLVGGYGIDGTFNPQFYRVVVNSAFNTSRNKYLCLSAVNISTTTYVSDIEFKGQDGSSFQKHAYAVYALNSTGLVLQRVVIDSGDGLAGQDGSDGLNAITLNPAPGGWQGATGSSTGTGCSTSYRLGGNGGSNSITGSISSGGTGGDGGSSDTSCDFNPFDFNVNYESRAGLAGMSTLGAASGYGGGDCQNGLPGGPGVAGAPGNTGASGRAFLPGRLSSDGFFDVQGNGGTGGVGQPGRGGAGGGGGGGCDTDGNYAGAGGGGGGAGGAPARSGGIGGTAGGSSFGIFAVNSTIKALRCNIKSGKGGNGGKGGDPGIGQPGGLGGPGGSRIGSGGSGGRGGNGGNGGNSGAGGDGVGGHSIAVYLHNAALISQENTFQTSAAGSGGSGARSQQVFPSASGGTIEPLLQEQTLTIPPITEVDNCLVPLVYDVQASSGLPVTITTLSPNATVTGNSISFSASGDVTLQLAQSGNEYFAPVSTSVILSVDCEQPQTITIEPPGVKVFGDTPFEIVATATSGLPVSMEVVNGPGELTGNLLTMTGAGDITVNASQEGNDFFEAAPTVTFDIVVSKADQVITFPPMGDHTLGDAPVALNATANTALPVAYFVSGSGVLSGNMVTLLGPGEISVVATQQGNENYNPVTSAIQNFTVLDANGSTIPVWFADVDGDGFGDGNSALASCLPLAGYVQDNRDCNDADVMIQPGSPEIEDGIDNNCDGHIDEGFELPPVDDVTVTAVCSDNPNKYRRWEIHNPNATPITLAWEIVGTSEKSWIDLQAGHAYLTTNAIKKNSNILRIYWHNEKGEKQSLETTSVSTKCEKQNSNGRVATGENSQESFTSDMNVFPNPGISHITVSITTNAAIETTLQMITPTGVIKEDTPVQLGEGVNYITRDVSALPRGVYFIRAGRQSVRFIKN